MHSSFCYTFHSGIWGGQYDKDKDLEAPQLVLVSTCVHKTKTFTYWLALNTHPMFGLIKLVKHRLVKRPMACFRPGSNIYLEITSHVN